MKQTQNARQYDYMYKLVIVGNSSVGKSSLLKRFTDDYFQQSYLATIGVDFKFKTLQLKQPQNTVKLQIWDTAGQQRFRTITSAYYKGAQGIAVVYDVRTQQSFDDVKDFWISEIKKYGQKDVQLVLIGNKVDCEDRVIQTQQVNQFIKDTDISSIQVSAKTGSGVNEAFQILAKKCIQKFGKLHQGSKEAANVLDDIRKKKKQFQLKSGKQKTVGQSKKCC